MVRVISQETFDAVVKENMEEFDMSREEAVQEAVEQFQSQVNLASHANTGFCRRKPSVGSAVLKREY